MSISSLIITIDNYGNQAMADDPNGETCRILRKVCQRIEGHGSLIDADGPVMDGNGNRVGIVTVEEE